MRKDSLLLQPIQVGNLTLKNRVMFPPLTTGYEERDGSIGERSLAFYERLAKGGTGYVVIGGVAPVMTASPTPKLCDDRQIPAFKRLADTLHKYDCKVALQIFHPEYDVPGVGRLIMLSRKAAMEAQEAKAKGDMATFKAKMAESGKIANGESSTILPTILADFKAHNVQQYVSTKVSAIEEGCVKAAQGEEEISIPCDMVVMAVGSRKNVLDVEGVTVPVYYAGDCSGERTAGILEAVRGGYNAANEI